MSIFSARQLLWNAAVEYQRGRQNFSREQISKKIDEIKYLSTQKKVPRVSLRKEIVHLEYLLQGILELDRIIARQKTQDTAKVAALKKQISQLKQRLTALSDQELPRKVEKLSYVLGDYLARKDTSEEIKEVAPAPSRLSLYVTHDQQRRIESLRQRLEALRQEMDLTRQLGSKDPSKMDVLESKIDVLEQKLNPFLSPAALSPLPSSEEVSHKMIFTHTGRPLKEELLPPPQPIRKKELTHPFP